MDRLEHLNWCKQRAREYLHSGNLVEAVTSMMSDLGKHPETVKTGSALAMLGLLALQQAQGGDSDGVKRYIEGFN